MILYHGSNQDIEEIDLKKGLKYKDFGQGFYLTPDKATATRMAHKKARLFGGEAILITYELEDNIPTSSVKIKTFPEKASKEWFLFIDANRDKNRKSPVHDYDIVVGPIADDGVVLQLTNYRENIYSAELAAEQLQDKYLDQQYYFGTKQALSFLHKIKVEKL